MWTRPPDPGEPTAHYLAALRAADRNDWRVDGHLVAAHRGGVALSQERFVTQLATIGKDVDAYNKSVGSLESMVLPSARRFHDLKAIASDRDINTVAPLTKETRALMAEELTRPRSERE